MNSDSIIQKARDLAGLENFDSDSFREGLDLASTAILSNPYRTEQGAAIIEGMFVNNLATRLQVADYARRHPEVTSAAIKQPIFIMGMPRTGTTMASYLLGADPSWRSLLRWEVATPVPPPNTATLKTDPRCLAMIEADKKGSPFDHIHYEAPDGPTECTFVMAHDFKSLFVESMAGSPAYSQWYLNADLTSAYEYHQLYLQVLQSNAPGTWALKLPSHALGVDIIRKMYPDARIIWTHRDPYKATGSLISMIANAAMLSCYAPNVERLVSTYPEQMAEHLRRPMAIQDKEENDPFYHLFYHRMASDPIGEMHKLYDWLGTPLSPQGEQGMQTWLANNPQGRFGNHNYGLDKFGLSVDDLRPFF